MSDQEESDKKEDEPLESDKKTDDDKSDSNKCKNCAKCKGGSECKHKKAADESKTQNSTEFIEDLERKWATDDELSHIEELIDRSEQNPKKIFNSLKKKIFNFR